MHFIHFRLPIEELFYHGKNKRGRKKEQPTTATTTTTTTTTVSPVGDDAEYDYEYDIWDDYFEVPDTNYTYVPPPAPLVAEKGRHDIDIDCRQLIWWVSDLDY